MKIYIFSNGEKSKKRRLQEMEIRDIFETVGNQTNSSNLVISCYLLEAIGWTGGSYFRNWHSPVEFSTRRGRWKLSANFPIPSDLPVKYKLIRLLFDLKQNQYPLVQQDRYDWSFRYKSLTDHLAFIFAHELHHFRRYHLGLHPREGEQSANRWALNHVNNLSFQVTGKKLNRRKKRLRLKQIIFQQIDPYKNFRSLTAGDYLLIQYDPHGRYLNQKVEVIRPIRSNSKRVVIRTTDGKQWRWPIDWLTRLT